jgi:hypothetical protein
MTGELEKPADDEHAEADLPNPWNPDRSDEERYRKRDEGDADGVAETVEGIPMARRVLSHPLIH